MQDNKTYVPKAVVRDANELLPIIEGNLNIGKAILLRSQLSGCGGLKSFLLFTKADHFSSFLNDEHIRQIHWKPQSLISYCVNPVIHVPWMTLYFKDIEPIFKGRECLGSDLEYTDDVVGPYSVAEVDMSWSEGKQYKQVLLLEEGTYINTHSRAMYVVPDKEGKLTLGAY